jgi:hypothetical protein
MKENIKRVLTNHSQSSAEGLLMLVGGTLDQLHEALDELIEEGWLTTSTTDWMDMKVTVYKKKKPKQAKLF